MLFSLPEFTKTKFLDVEVLSQKNREPGANPGVKLPVQLDVSNHVLTMFAAACRPAMFYKAATTPADGPQGRMDVENNDLPDVTEIARALGKFHWAAKLTGYAVEIDYGAGGKSNLKLADAILESFHFLCKQGGTVSMWFCIEVNDVPDPVFSKLGRLKSRDVQLKLIPPAIDPDLASDLPAGGAGADGAAGKAGAKDGGNDDGPWPFPNTPPTGDKPAAAPGKPTSRRAKTPEQAFVDTAK